MKTLAVVVSLGLVGALAWLTRNNTPSPTEEAAPVPPAATRAGITFTPRHPAPEWPKSEFPSDSPWYQEPFTHFKLKRAVTNDGLRHFGTKFIGPMRYLPPRPTDHGSKYRVEIPPGYKMVQTNLDHNHTGLAHVDFLVIPRPAPTITDQEAITAAIHKFTSAPDDDTWLERRDALIDSIGVDEWNRRERERIALLNQQSDEHFRQEMSGELEKAGFTPEGISEWFVRWEREQEIMNRLGTDNYTKARRSIERAERARQQTPP